MEIVSDSLAFGVMFAIVLTVIQRGIGFARGVVFCRMMTEQELGQWSMVFSFLMLLAPFAVLGLPGCFGRFVEHYLQRGQLTTFVRRISTVSCCLTLVLAVSIFAAPDYYSNLIFRSAEYSGVVNAMAFAIVFVAANNFLATLMESLRQFRLATIMRFATGVSFAIVGTAMIAVWQDGTSAATIGFGIACLIGMIPAIYFLWRHREALADSGESLKQLTMWRRIAPFAIWLWATNLVTNMFEVSDRYMLIHWSGVPAEEAHGFVGQYHSGRVLPLLLLGVGVVLEGMLLPYMTALWEKKKKSEANDLICLALKMIATGFTLVGLAILLLSPLMFDYVLNGRYNDGQAVLPITLVYCIWFSLFSNGLTYLWVAEKGKLVFAVTAVGLFLNLALNASLIPYYGLWGAVSATSIATFSCLMMALAVNRLVGFRVNSGVFVTSLLPMVILMPIVWSLLATAIFAAFSVWSPYIFSKREKALAIDKLNVLKSRFLSMKK